MSKINIKESLLNIDKSNYCKYDLTTLYECCSLDQKDKEQLALMLYKECSAEELYDFLYQHFLNDAFDIDEDPVDELISDDYFPYSVSDFIQDGEEIKVEYQNPFFETYNISAGKIGAEDTIKFLNNILNNPKYKLTDKAKEKIYKNSAPWGLTVKYTPTADIEGTNDLLATGDFSGEASFGESTSMPKSKVNIDMWYNDPIDEIYKIDMSFSDADLEYRGNLYNKEGKAIGDFTTKDSVALYDAFPQFNWDAYFGESVDQSFEKDDRVTDGDRQGTVLDCDSQKVLVEWDYSDTDDIEWVDKSTLELVNKTNSGFLPNMDYCPACGGTRFNTKTGVCIDCGYDEKDRGYTDSDDYDESVAPYKKEEFKKQLQDELYNAATKVLLEPSWGFENLKEIDDLLGLVIEVNDYKGDYDNDFVIEVRGEFNYDELVSIADILDPIIQKYDKNAYFEPVTGGITVAYLKFPKKLKEDFEDGEIVTGEQEFDSAATSINSNKLPAVYNMVDFTPGEVVIDFGGGKFDNAVNYLKDKDVTLLVYDPYNRSAEHNKEVLRVIRENGGADAAINSNVLNVIKEPEARQQVLKNIKKLVKPGAPIYITVYEGSGKGNEGPTKAGYQLNRKTSEYIDEISQIFPNVKRRGKLITTINESFRFSGLRQANIDAIDYFMEFEHIYAFPKGKFLATDWKELRDGIVMGMDSDIEIAEGIMEYLQKEIDFNNKHKEIYEDDPQAELTLEIYNKVKKEYEKEISKYESVSSKAVNEASYGGAFDIEDDQYFTREEIVDVAEKVCEHLDETYPDKFDVSDVYMETPTIIHVEVISEEGNWASANAKIDMRKIKKPSDIMKYDVVIGDLVYYLRQELEDLYSKKIHESKSSEKPGDTFEVIKDAYIGPVDSIYNSKQGNHTSNINRLKRGNFINKDGDIVFPKGTRLNLSEIKEINNMTYGIFIEDSTGAHLMLGVPLSNNFKNIG